MDFTITVRCPDLLQAVGMLAELLHGVPSTKPEAVAQPKTAEAVAKPKTAEAVAKPAAKEAPKYSQRAISLAGARLIQKDPAKVQAVHELLEKYGVKATKDLPEDSVDAFAEDLLGLGAEIDA